MSIAAPDASTFHHPADAAADPLVGQVLDSRYEFVAKLGEGGMGCVYRARRVHLAGEVAIKVLHKKYVAEDHAVERFRREARAASQLNHPNVVTIHDFGESRGDDAPAYIVMELVEGESLRDLLQRERRLKPERAVALLRDICAGVGAAHRRDIVHRDLKPDNVIVLPPNEDREREQAKVVDFGIAKLRDTAGGNTLTRTGALIGTPYYMSPEQCRGENLDARADVYSLGGILYEMLCGEPPFTANNLADLVAKHLYEEPPLDALREVLPELGTVCARALSKDPQKRQADATQLSRELRDAERAAAARRAAEERAWQEAEQRRRRAEEEAAERARQEEEAKRLREAEAKRARAEEAARGAEAERRRREEAARRLKEGQADDERTIETTRIDRRALRADGARQAGDQRSLEAGRRAVEKSAQAAVESRRPEEGRAGKPRGVFESLRRWIDGEADEEEGAGPRPGRDEVQARRPQTSHLESLRRWIDGETAVTDVDRQQRFQTPGPVPTGAGGRRTAWVVAGVGALTLTGLVAVVTPLMWDRLRSGVASNTPTQLLPSPTPAAENDVRRFSRLKLRVDASPAAEAARIEAETGNQPLNSNDPQLLYLYGRALLLNGKTREAVAVFNQASRKLAENPSSSHELFVTELLSAKVVASLLNEDLNSARGATREIHTYVKDNRGEFRADVQRIQGTAGGNALASQDAQLLYDFGRALLFSGEYVRAQDAFKAAINRAVENPIARNGQARLDANFALIVAALSAEDINGARDAARQLKDLAIRPSPSVTPF